MNLPLLTTRQKEIILLLAKFRFLSRIQIQTLLSHKTPAQVNLWLKDLTEKGYTHKIYSASFPENTKPATYYLSLNGIRFLKENTEYPQEYLRRLYREGIRSKEFISKSLFIAD